MLYESHHAFPLIDEQTFSKTIERYKMTNFQGQISQVPSKWIYNCRSICML